MKFCTGNMKPQIIPNAPTISKVIDQKSKPTGTDAAADTKRDDTARVDEG
jgi:hypothetical protein